MCMAVPSGIPEQVSVINLPFSGRFRFFFFWLHAVVRLCFVVESLLII